MPAIYCMCLQVMSLFIGDVFADLLGEFLLINTHGSHLGGDAMTFHFGTFSLERRTLAVMYGMLNAVFYVATLDNCQFCCVIILVWVTFDNLD